MRPATAADATLRLRRPRTPEDQVLSRCRDKTASVDTAVHAWEDQEAHSRQGPCWAGQMLGAPPWRVECFLQIPWFCTLPPTVASRTLVSYRLSLCFWKILFFPVFLPRKSSNKLHFRDCRASSAFPPSKLPSFLSACRMRRLRGQFQSQKI